MVDAKHMYCGAAAGVSLLHPLTAYTYSSPYTKLSFTLLAELFKIPYTYSKVSLAFLLFRRILSYKKFQLQVPGYTLLTKGGIITIPSPVIFI